MIFQQVMVELIRHFVNVLILIHIWKASSDVIELAVAAFRQKRWKVYTAKCYMFTVPYNKLPFQWHK